MTAREWKPGDVAMTQFGPSVVVSGDECVHAAHGPHWHHMKGGWDHLSGHKDARPVVMIDPDDREQVGRLAELAAFPPDSWQRNDLANALREFANPTPPKPDEPTGLGAVVEDAEGADWHRTREGRWIAEDGLRSRASGWTQINAVRVISEGVTA